MTDASATEKRINIPLTPEVHKLLRQQAGSLGVTMYELAAKAVEAAVENRTVSVVADPSLGDVRTEEAIAAIGGDPHAPAAIARHYLNLNKPYLAAVMAAFAADRASQDSPLEAGDRARASRDLVRFAGERLPAPIKIALLERAVAMHPSNLVARNLLGQQLYFTGQHSRAIEHLAAVRNRDNRALLFHGFAVLRDGLHAGDRTRARQGRDDVVEALEKWSFGSRDPQERAKWIKRLEELDGCGPEFAQSVDELIGYANMNSDWREPVSRADIESVRQP